jgi:hypothetical protein
MTITVAKGSQLPFLMVSSLHSIILEHVKMDIRMIIIITLLKQFHIPNFKLSHNLFIFSLIHTNRNLFNIYIYFK